MANLKKNAKGYGYNYTDLAEIHRYLDDNNLSYYQFIRRIEGDDYVMTRRCIDGEWEAEALQGSRVAQATLQGIKNPAQEQGSALTYARRYSLLMAFGLSTEDDDGKALDRKPEPKEYKCSECGKKFEDFTTREGKKYTAGQMYHISETKNGKALCIECATKNKEEKGE